MTNKTFPELFPGGGGGGSSAGGWTRAIFASVTLPAFTEAGTVVINQVGAGGAGATGNNNNGTTGGNSAPWGRKRIKVAIGDVLAFSFGAAGAGVSTANSNGGNGGTTTITLNGVTIMTVQGGEGGGFSVGTALASAPVPTATVTGADYWVSGVRAGTAIFASTAATTGGGAAVDLLSNGTGRSPNRTTYSTAIGGTVGKDTGGLGLVWVELAAWGIVFTDQSAASSTVGYPGRGAEMTPNIAPGAFAGGASYLQKPGYGAGGAGGPSGGAPGAPGGDAYAYITFTPLA